MKKFNFETSKKIQNGKLKTKVENSNKVQNGKLKKN